MTQLELPQRVAASRPPPVSDLTAPAVSRHLLCNSCSQLLFNGCQTPHGCRLCQICVQARIPASGAVPCPGNTDACREDGEDAKVSRATCFPDLATRREVAKLLVRCPNHESGCGVTIAWKLMDQHLDSCDFQLIDCDLCHRQQLKMAIRHHMQEECEQRRVKCEQCSVLVRFCEMKSTHRNLESEMCCAKFIDSCPHCRDEARRLDRRAFVLHLPLCPERPIACRYAHLGCSARIRRRDLDSHCKDSADFHITLLDSKMSHSRGVATPHGGAAAVPAQGDCSAQVSEAKRKVQLTHDYFKKLQINVANWAHTMLEFQQLADSYGGVSQMRDSLRQLEDRVRQVEATRAAPSGERRVQADVSASGGPARLLADSQATPGLLQVRVLQMEARLESLEAATSYDGSLTWKVMQLSSRRRDPSKAALSPPFFLGRFGCMFRARLLLSGDGVAAGGHVSAQVVGMKSEFDDLQDWPVAADVTFRLLCLSDRQRDVVKTVRFDSPGFGRPKDDFSVFCAEPQLVKLADFEARFVKSDSCFLQVEVADLRSDGAARRARRRTANVSHRS